MWFNLQKKYSSKKESKDNYQAILSSLNTNGISLSMQELLQYQSKSRLIDLAGKKNIQGKQAGNYIARSKGRGMEFDEVRHYQTGDDVRAIDWRVTARTGKTHTKLFREEIERPVLVATDLSKDMHFGSQLLFKSVQAAHLAALVAWHTKNRGDRLGGLVFRDEQHIELKPRSRKAGVLHYLHALTTLNNQTTPIVIANNKPKNNAENKAENNQVAEDNTAQSASDVSSNTPQSNVSAASISFEQHCARLRHLAKPGSLVYLITDGHALFNESTSQHTLRHLSQISKHCELVVCLISDPLEQTLPESTLKLAVTLTDGVNRQQLTLGDKQTAVEYQQQAHELSETMQKKLQSAGARVIHFSAGESLEQQLKDNGAAL